MCMNAAFMQYDLGTGVVNVTEVRFLASDSTGARREPITINAR